MQSQVSASFSAHPRCPARKLCSMPAGGCDATHLCLCSARGITLRRQADKLIPQPLYLLRLAVTGRPRIPQFCNAKPWRRQRGATQR